MSLSGRDGVAVAIAGDGGRCRGIGIHLAHLDRAGGNGRQPFSPDEHALIAALDQPLRDEWALRLCCAKEAASKALGQPPEQLTSLVAATLDPAAGTVQITAWDREPFTVQTVRDGDWIAARAIR